MKQTNETTELVEKKKVSAKDLLAKAGETGTVIVAVGSAFAKEGVQVAKKGAISAKDQVVKTAGTIRKARKEAQNAVLTYVDRKKNAKFLKTKMQSFEDGMKAGKVEAVDYIKKYANFCLAATAISFFFARCDGEISEEELLEIQFDLDAIIKNRDLPEELRNKLAEISLDRDLTFDEVRIYLDGVGVETVQEFQKDIDEIIFADGVLTDSEKKAKLLFDDYLKSRLEG